MLIRKENNRGFTLVEVIVSMLVLSITIVSVLSAFTLSAKSNMRTKKLQAAESLMEDLSEYVAAGGGVGGRDYTYFGTVTSAEDPSDSNKTNITISGVNKGFYEYEVKIVENKAPAKYTTTEANDYEVFSFGSEGNNAIIINASESGMTMIESNALAYYTALHEAAIVQKNAERAAVTPMPGEDPPEPLVPATDAEIKASLVRELQLETADEGGQMVIKASAAYQMTGGIEFPDTPGAKYYSQEFYVSEKFDKTSGTGTNKLNQIYVLYSDSTAAAGDGASVGYMDLSVADSIAELDASLFIVNQESGIKDLSDPGVLNSELYKESNIEGRVGSSEQLNVKVVSTPQRLDVYSSDKIILSGVSTNVEKHSNTLIAGAKEARVVEITIQIIDAETGAVLMSDSDVYLQ